MTSRFSLLLGRLVGVAIVATLLLTGHWVIALVFLFIWWADACAYYGI